MPEFSLPDTFVSRLQQILNKDDYQQVLHTFYTDRAVTFRINTLKADVQPVLQELAITAQPLQWCRQAFWVDAPMREHITLSPAFAEGRLYIQNAASLLAPLFLQPSPGEEVLDLAAAPGGKTLMMAQMMNNQGRIAAVEVVKGRFFKLKNNLNTFGASVVVPYLKDGRVVGWKLPGRFDRVLLDAPCSSESRFVANKPESFAHWNERKVKEVQRKQKKLICSALAALKPGGLLVYSTCSYSVEENEMVVQHALKKFKDQIVIEDAPLRLPNFRPGLLQWKKREFDPSMSLAVRVLPDCLMHGFFVCRIRKLTTTPGSGDE